MCWKSKVVCHLDKTLLHSRENRDHWEVGVKCKSAGRKGSQTRCCALVRSAQCFIVDGSAPRINQWRKRIMSAIQLEAGFRFLNGIVKGGNQILGTAYFQTVLRFMTDDIHGTSIFSCDEYAGHHHTYYKKNDILHLPCCFLFSWRRLRMQVCGHLIWQGEPTSQKSRSLTNYLCKNSWFVTLLIVWSPAVGRNMVSFRKGCEGAKMKAHLVQMSQNSMLTLVCDWLHLLRPLLTSLWAHPLYHKVVPKSAVSLQAHHWLFLLFLQCSSLCTNCSSPDFCIDPALGQHCQVGLFTVVRMPYSALSIMVGMSGH